MTVVVCGISHKSAPVQFRERLSFAEWRLPQMLSQLCAGDGTREAVILSTCNRTEVYVNAATEEVGTRAILAAITEWQELDGREQELLGEHLYVHSDRTAVEHLFRVVCSLDSLVLGEAQILGQVKRAFRIAQESDSIDSLFNQLFRTAIELGKQARSETDIGANSVSVSTAAVDLAQRVFGGVQGLRVLLVGTGQMGELTALYLKEKGARFIYLANRTYEGALEMSERIGASAVAFERLPTWLRRVDVVICCTAATGYVISKGMVQAARRRHDSEQLLLIDIAMPRNIDPDCSTVDNVSLFDIDDLKQVAGDNADERRLEAAKVEELAAAKVDEFLIWLQEREVAPTIRDIFEKADRYAQSEANRAAKALAGLRGKPLGETEREVLAKMATSVVKKVMHGPTVRLRKQAQSPEGYRYTQAARYLFGLDVNPANLVCAQSGRSCKVLVGGSCDRARKGECHEHTKAG